MGFWGGTMSTIELSKVISLKLLAYSNGLMVLSLLIISFDCFGVYKVSVTTRLRGRA